MYRLCICEIEIGIEINDIYSLATCNVEREDLRESLVSITLPVQICRWDLRALAYWLKLPNIS